MMTCGYIRVSTREQNGARQLAALRQAGIPEDSCTRAQIVTFLYRSAD